MSFRSALTHHDFRSLWIAQVISRIGDGIHEIALIWIVYEVTENPALMSAVVVASVVPSALVSLPAGSVVDKVNRKYVLVGTELARGTAVLAIPLLGYHRLLVPIVVSVAFVAGVMEAFAGPARSALLPQLVPETEIDSANALTQMTTTVSQTLYVVGGVVVAIFGVFGAFYLDALSFFVSAAVLTAISTRSGTPDRETDQSEGVFGEVRTGLSFVRHDSVLVSIVVVSVMTGFAMGPLGVVIPFFADNVLDYGSKVFGLLYGAIYAGVFVGGMIVGGLDTVIEQHRGRIVTGGILCVGISFMLAAVLPQRTPIPLVVAAGLFLLSGAAISLIQVPLQTVVQTTVPDDKRGRVFAVMGAAGLVAPPISIAVAGPLIGLVGAVTVLLGQGGLVLVSGMIVALTPLAHLGKSEQNVTNSAD